MTDLLTSLRENFGGVPDTSTLKGIKSYTALWLEEHEMTSSRDLEQACHDMRRKLSEAITATEKELDSTGDTHESLADPVERCLEAYERLREVLFDMGEAVRLEKRSEVLEILEEVDDGALFLKQAQEDLDSWLQDSVLKCPRCGGHEQDPCPSCKLDLVYLDPKGGSGARDRSALLPSKYGELYETFENIRSGKTRLANLSSHIEPLEREVNSFRSLLSISLNEEKDNAQLKESIETLEALKKGLEQMKAVLSNRKITELQDGWLKVFRNAVRFQRLRHNILETMGGEEGAKILEAERRVNENSDSFSKSPEED